MSAPLRVEVEIAIPIRNVADVIVARSEGERLAERIGIGKLQVADVAIGISELASNLVKHRAVQGMLMLRVVERDGVKALEVITSDRGPGITSIGHAMAEGYSTAGTLGIGLAAVERLMDEFEIASDATTGTVVTARKRLRPPGAHVGGPRFELGIMSRPIKGGHHNGDGYFVTQYEDRVVLAVIDGLGHGKNAEQAARVAVQVLRDQCHEPIAAIFEMCHQRLRQVRGATMAICRIDTEARLVCHAGVGNVKTRIYGSESSSDLRTHNGTVGINLPNTEVRDYRLPPDGLVIMFSDGISDRFSRQDIQALSDSTPETIARYLLDHFGRDHDDATVIVGRLNV